MNITISPIENNQQTYDSLYVSLLDGLGTLQLLLAVCENDSLRYQIIERYERELDQEARTLRVNLDLTEPSLRECLQRLSEKPERLTETKQIVTVLGAEQLNAEALTKFWGYLQWTRESLRQFSCPIVLWLPKRLLKDMVKKAPDFWSWRNGIFLFEAQFRNVPDQDLLVPDLGGNGKESLFSVEQLEHSLQQAIAQWGEDNPKVEPLYAQLGQAYTQRIVKGRPDNWKEEATRAEQLLEKAIALESQQPESLAQSLNNLAELYLEQGKYTEAEPLYLQALAIREKQLGSEHPDVAESLNDLATLYLEQGKYTEAEPLYLRALAIREQQLGADHSDVASSLNNLAGLYESQGRYTEAELLYRRSLAIWKQQLGTDHPHVATSLNNLAELYRTQGKYTEAEPLYLRALAIRKQQLRFTHPHVANSLNNLALLYEAQGKYKEAEHLFLQSLAIRQKQLGEDHPEVAESLHNLAGLYQNQGKYTEAEPLYLRALAIREKQLGEDHPDVANSLNNLAELYRVQGKYKEADPLYQKALQICEQRLGVGHPHTMTVRGNYAQCLKEWSSCSSFKLQ